MKNCVGFAKDDKACRQLSEDSCFGWDFVESSRRTSVGCDLKGNHWV